MDIHGRAGHALSRFEADVQGVRIHEPGGQLELRWSTVRAVDLECVGQGANVGLKLNKGTTVFPSALQGITPSVGAQLQELWWRYGPPGASAMWGRPGVPTSATVSAP